MLLSIHGVAGIQTLLRVLRRREHRMLVGHHQRLLRLVVLRVRVPRSICIDSRRLAHDEIDDTATVVHHPADLLLPLIEELPTGCSFFNLPLPEFLIGLFFCLAQIAIVDDRNNLCKTVKRDE